MGRKLRILEVNKAYFPHVGGIETLVEQYSRELGNISSVSVKTLVCRDGRGGTVRERLNGVDLTRAGSLGTYFFMSAVAFVSAAVPKNGCQSRCCAYPCAVPSC